MTALFKKKKKADTPLEKPENFVALADMSDEKLSENINEIMRLYCVNYSWDAACAMKEYYANLPEDRRIDELKKSTKLVREFQLLIDKRIVGDYTSTQVQLALIYLVAAMQDSLATSEIWREITKVGGSKEAFLTMMQLGQLAQQQSKEDEPPKVEENPKEKFSKDKIGYG